MRSLVEKRVRDVNGSLTNVATQTARKHVGILKCGLDCGQSYLLAPTWPVRVQLATTTWENWIPKVEHRCKYVEHGGK